MKKDYLKYLAALLLFGSNGIVASRIALSSYEIVLLRAGIGCVMLAVLFALRRQRLTCLQHRRELLDIALSGAAMGASWMCLYEGYVRIGVGMASLPLAELLALAVSVYYFRTKKSVYHYA